MILDVRCTMSDVRRKESVVVLKSHLLSEFFIS